MFCLDEGILRAHLDGELTAYETLSVERHLSLCDPCRGNFAALVAQHQRLDALLGDLAPLAHELRTDAFAAQCAFTRFKAQYEVDLNPVTFLQPAAANLQFALPEPGGLLPQLLAAAQQFVRDFGKRVPQVKATGELRFLLPDEALWERLWRAARANWEEFRRDPQGFLAYLLHGEGNSPVRRKRLQTGTAVAMASYVLVFTTLIVAGVLDFGTKEISPEVKSIEFVKLASPPPLEAKAESGPADVPGGKGGVMGGNKAKNDPARGGGGGGRMAVTPATLGNPPQQSPLPQLMPPNPEPIKIDSSLVVPETTVGDPALSKALPRPTGLKDGPEAAPSSGPGSKAGIGSGLGTGVGAGNGKGQGTGNNDNQGGGAAEQGGGLSKGLSLSEGAEIFDATNSLQPRILFKESAKYTEEARLRGTRGGVVLSVVFGADGRIYNVQVVRGLPQGLTESALEAARKIRFRPALRNGLPVNVRMQLEYKFNLF